MPKTIVWSTYAEADINGIIDYLQRNWDDKVLERFVKLTDDMISQIANQPKNYPLINKRLKVRKCVLTQQNSLYYREHLDRIEK